MGGGADYPCSAETSAVQHFVLVHGAGHGGWCWYKIKCLLENTGHTVTCPDLSSCGVDPCSVDSISTFQEYNKPLDDILSAVPEGKKIILVGHSAGGQNITEVIHKFPNKIKVAVFVGACMLRNGFLTQEDIKVGAPDLSRYGDIYDYGYGKGRENPPTNVVLKKEVQREILYQMSPLEVWRNGSSLRPLTKWSGVRFPTLANGKRYLASPLPLSGAHEARGLVTIVGGGYTG